MIDCGAFQGITQEDDLTPYVDVDSLAAVFITLACGQC